MSYAAISSSNIQHAEKQCIKICEIIMIGSKRINIFHNDKGNHRWQKLTLTVARTSHIQIFDSHCHIYP